MATDPMTDTPAFAVLPQEQVGLLFRAALDPEGTGDLSERDAAALARSSSQFLGCGQKPGRARKQSAVCSENDAAHAPRAGFVPP